MDRFTATKKAGVFGIFGNIFLLVIKATVGFISGSQAMIADSVNSAGDIFASLMTFIGNKIASKPGDSDHNFGHGKSEYIFSLLISISMIAVSIKLLIDSITSLIFKNELTFSIYLVIVCIVTIITKAFLYIYTNKAFRKFNNILLKANAKDHFNDCIVTSFTLISILFASQGIYWVDSLVGIGIAIWICYCGIKIFIESYNVLMDISVDETTHDTILNLVRNYKEIKNVESLYSTPSGYKYIIILTISVDGNMSTFGSHKLADSLEKDIKKLDNVSNAIIHVNPV